jgi:hypothetical protein
MDTTFYSKIRNVEERISIVKQCMQYDPDRVDSEILGLELSLNRLKEYLNGRRKTGRDSSRTY